MARKNKYSKLKPKVSPLTYIILGLFFIGLVLTIVLSIDTPKQSFNKRFELENHNFLVTKLKNVEKEIENDKDVIVVIQVGLKSTEPKAVLEELQEVYNGKELYAKEEYIDLEELPENIYYVEVKDESVIEKFVKEYEVKKTNSKPMVLAFSNGELVSEFDSENDPNLHASDKEKATLIYNLKQFFKDKNEFND